MKLSDDDIDRIANRVADVLEERKEQRRVEAARDACDDDDDLPMERGTLVRVVDESDRHFGKDGVIDAWTWWSRPNGRPHYTVALNGEYGYGRYEYAEAQIAEVD